MLYCLLFKRSKPIMLSCTLAKYHQVSQSFHTLPSTDGYSGVFNIGLHLGAACRSFDLHSCLAQS